MPRMRWRGYGDGMTRYVIVYAVGSGPHDERHYGMKADGYNLATRINRIIRYGNRIISVREEN